MGELIELDEHRPHVVVVSERSSTVYVAPTIWLERWASGADDVEAPPDDMLRALVLDWLEIQGCAPSDDPA